MTTLSYFRKYNKAALDSILEDIPALKLPKIEATKVFDEAFQQPIKK